MLIRSGLAALALASFVAGAPPISAQTVTSPKQQFGHEIGADYQLPNYQALVAYWQKLDRESDRLKVVEIGKTAEGRAQMMGIITSPENHRRLDRFRDIARRLALAEGLTDEQAQALAREGKAVVWIDGGLHATEVLGAQQLMETVYQLVSRSDPETQRILHDCIILAVHANPDGHDLVANWYTREKDPQKRSTSGIPRLYQKYIGHDNNRDFYIANQPETQNMNQVMYQEWFPQIVYNHHQTGPAGAVMFAPPFRDPFNYVYDPLVPTQIDVVGAAMHTRFAREGKPGVVTREAAGYSTWWNGGLRTMVYFHNMIGLLTETIGNPTPIQIPFVPDRLLPSTDQFFPITPQSWHFRQSIDYSVTANYAVLDVASRNREHFLFNIYRMGKNSIERGSRDSWTMRPSEIARLKEEAAKDPRPDSDVMRRSSQGRGGVVLPDKYFERLRTPGLRDPRGYVIPSDQPDFPTATKFVNALIRAGITVHRASAAFTAGGKSYPAGSYVVRTAQAFRPHVVDMFEPQDHPNDFRYPGGPPIPPYDNAGWTLAFQMGVAFDRILDGLDGPFEPLRNVQPMPPSPLTTAANGAYRIDHRVNNAVIAVNRLMKAGQEVWWHTAGQEGGFFVAASPAATDILQNAARDLGVVASPSDRPESGLTRVRLPRIGLWDQYGGSMPSGWTRWLLEQFEFPFEVVYPQTLDAGNLNARYDVLVFVDGAIPERDVTPGQGGGFGAQPAADRIPEEFRGWLGRVTVARTVPQLKAFAEQGGTILTIGSSTSLAYHLRLPISNALVDATTGEFKPLSQEKFYIPGSILRTAVDTAHPLAHGMRPQTDVFFDHSPAFRLGPDAAIRGVRAVAWFDSPAPLRSGWAWGQHYLQGAASVVDAEVGKGRLVLLGPEVLFRGQPHGTFKLFFNGLYLAGASRAEQTTSRQ